MEKRTSGCWASFSAKSSATDSWLMLPETARENQVMGEARDSLMEKGREAVRDAAEKVKETAGEVQKVATRALGATEPEPSTAKGGDNL